MRAFTVSAVLLVCLLGGQAWGQDTEITSFRNGRITWSNSNPNLYYTVQWASSLTGGTWASSYSTLQDIQSWSSTITSEVPVFLRVMGSSNRVSYPAPVPKTGQTTSYASGDDGEHQAGVESPTPRFSDRLDGTVVDNLTGLMWTKDANLTTNPVLWADAIAYCNALTLAGHADWRLPNVRELLTLLDYGVSSGAMLPDGHPFTDAQGEDYWSGTSDPLFTDSFAYSVHMDLAESGGGIKDEFSNYVWAVRTP